MNSINQQVTISLIKGYLKRGHLLMKRKSLSTQIKGRQSKVPLQMMQAQ